MSDTPSLPASGHGEVAGLVEELRAGLEGVTPGPWARKGDRRRWNPNYVESSKAHIADVMQCGIDKKRDPESEANAAHIARCSPGNIAKLIDHIDALTAQLASPTPSPVEARADGELIVRLKAYTRELQRNGLPVTAKLIGDAATALESTPAQPVREGQEGKTEPVAWRFEYLTYGGEWKRDFAGKEPSNGSGAIIRNVVPLYASQPEPAAEIARLRRALGSIRDHSKELTTRTMAIGALNGDRP